MSRHTLSVLVENKPGVLTRVAGLFARRSFNIHSLAVGPTEHEEISRITVVVDFTVSRDAMVWPMVAAGVSNDDIQYARGLTPAWDRED